MVNTFLIIEDYRENATILDSRRLGKQRLEAKQIIAALETNTGWRHHPITRSWEGYVESLKLYYNCIVEEWIKRGYQNNMELYPIADEADVKHPDWIKSKRIQYAMMSQLIQKDPTYYTVEKIRTIVSPSLFRHWSSLPQEYLDYGYIWPYKYTKRQLETLPLSALAEKKVIIHHCDKVGCRNKALYLLQDSSRCGVHRDKSIQILKCQVVCKNGNPCKNKAVYGEKKCRRH